LPAAGERGGTSDARRGAWDPAHRPSRDPDPAPCLGGAARARCALARAGRRRASPESATAAGRFAWVLVDYRWINSEHNQAEAGRAQGLEDRTGALQPTAAGGPLGVRRSTLDRVADLVSGARADEPHHEVADEP